HNSVCKSSLSYKYMRFILKRLIYQLLLTALFCTGFPLTNLRAQTLPPTRFDDRILINMAENRTPEKTGFFMFMSNTYRYGDIGIPAGLLIGGIAANNREMRQNSLY